MIWIYFDDIWQKYSKGSRIELACFSFYVGLLFYQFRYNFELYRFKVGPFLRHSVKYNNAAKTKTCMFTPSITITAIFV